MTIRQTIFLLGIVLGGLCTKAQPTTVDFFGEPVQLPGRPTPTVADVQPSENAILTCAAAIDSATLQPFLQPLLHYKARHKPDDWLYYQLVRRVAQYLSPKAENYIRYTLFKWWLLTRSGYDARLTTADGMLLFYVQCDERVYNIPSRTMDGKQYVCLNYHDYGFAIDFDRHRFAELPLPLPANAKPFSYRVQALPDFSGSGYTEKDLRFSDGVNSYAFRIKLNPQLQTLFSNYPVVDYDLQFNMPLSKPTYESLVPSLKKQVAGLKPKEGVEFLQRFTRYAFLFKPDGETFGREKRLTPEQTLLYEFSDCEDRAALFFFLVKEIYNLPMLVLTYPQHVTVAVQFEKAYGQTVEYNGQQYSICEPSPQRYDLNIGQLLPELKKQRFEIAYAYTPR